VQLANPSVEIGVLALLGIYAISARRMHRSFLLYQAVAFGGALILLIFTLDGPLETLVKQRLFAAHMVQHLVLALVIPPLLLLGTPDWILRPLVSFDAVKRIARVLVNPIVAYLLFSLVLVGMHSPDIYDRMCRDGGFHIVIHLLLLGTALLLWWPLLSPLPELPRLSYPVQMLYLFVWIIPLACIAAPITLAHHVIYLWYARGPHPFGLTPYQDQLLGGLIMWLGAGFYHAGILTAIFFQWVSHTEAEEAEADRDSGELLDAEVLSYRQRFKLYHRQ
jgi:putative membrane protein